MFLNFPPNLQTTLLLSFLPKRDTNKRTPVLLFFLVFFSLSLSLSLSLPLPLSLLLSCFFLPLSFFKDWIMEKLKSKLIPGMEQLNRDVDLNDFEQFKRRIEGDDGLPIEILGQTVS